MLTIRRTLVLLAVAAAALALAVPAAMAALPDDPDYAFACHSPGENPGVWPSTDPSVFSGGFYADGYWAPYAIKGSGTTQLGSYYLTCALPTGMATIGTYVTDGGVAVSAAPPWVTADGHILLGIYPIAAAAA